nr:RNA-directed DNA polymerase, eukaryota [Tanacetum cinerariifolium]
MSLRALFSNRGSSAPPIYVSLAIVMDDSCIVDKDLSCSLMGKIKDINALSNIYVIFANEGFDNVNISYLGGFWILIEACSVASKEKMLNHESLASWFFELCSADPSFVNSSSSAKKICVVTKVHTIINQRIKIIVKGKIYLIRVKELEAWAPEFNNEFCENSSSDEESIEEGEINSQKVDDFDHVSESSCMKECNEHEAPKTGTVSEDPFAIYSILKRNDQKEKSNDAEKSDPSFHPGFTPKGVNEITDEEANLSVNKSNSNHHCNKKTGSNGKCGSNRSLKLKAGGLILDVIEDLIKIGHAMRYNMEGCSKNIEAIVDRQGVTSDLPSIQRKSNLDFFIFFFVTFMAGDKRLFLSKEDLSGKISKTVFVTNFPDHLTARDLWNVCTAYGKVVDAYIPLKRSKSAIVMDDSCIVDKDLSCSLMGKIKDINALSNIYVIFANEGFDNVNISYLGGFWILIEACSVASKEKMLNHESLASCPSVGLSDGILCVWNPNVFSKESVTVSDSFVVVRGSSSLKLMFVSVYAPQDISERRSLWDYINHMINLWGGECIILGDFNEVRPENERFGSNFNEIGAKAFNHFISSSCLIDLPLEGYSFTWDLKYALKMRKLDRFLISEGLISIFPSLAVICLDRRLSDHRPILLRESTVDYGPTPFRVFHSWFTKDGFDNLIADTWNNLSIMETNKISLLRKKFQALKVRIKNWSRDEMHKASAISMISISGTLLILAQKAKIQWAIECDENSKYFHGIINKKWSQLAIRGILVDGEWIEDPPKVKNGFLKHFSNRFSMPTGQTINLDSHIFQKISIDQNADLESDVSLEEIKKAHDVVNAVKEIFSSIKFPPGSNSSFITLIPKSVDAKMVKDFRPISLIGSFYKILSNRLCTVMPDLISDVQTAFISKHQILDGPFILNEFISWRKYHKTKAMIFKADFEKAFDSVRWDYLDGVLNDFGFYVKWRGWIQACLSSAMGSILVNGSPSSEFKFHKGLKQGDPLSPFLYILVMESLHISFNNILNFVLYKGIRIDESLTLSHIFYADDAVFIGKWDKANVITIVNMLKCFYLASGLKINIQKRGLGISSFFAQNRALLFKWIWRFRSKDSSLWYRVIKAMYGDCGALNNTGTFVRSSTWTTIVRECGNLSSKGINLLSHIKKKVGNGANTSFWVDSWVSDIPLMQLYPRMFALDCNKISTVEEKINASFISCSFRRQPRGSFEKEQFSKLIEYVNSVTLSISSDRWIWSLDSSGEFSIKSTLIYIDDHLLLAVGAPTRWVKEVPIKINIMAWKVSLDKLPTRLNLSLRGIEIPSITCPICSCAGESCSHLFFSCSMARNITTKLARWWEFDCPDLFSYDDWLEWFHTLRFLKGGNLLERRTQDVLTIIENKSKVCNSRNKSVVSQVKSCDANSNSSSEIAKLTYAVNQQTSVVTTAMTTILKQFQATPPPASMDNIQGCVAAAAVNYNQGNSVYRPPGMANQIRPSGFAQPNVQNNQNRFSQPQGYNRGNNFNQEQSYQAPTQQNQVVSLNELEKVKRMNEANMKAMQNQINNVKNELRNEMKNSIQASLSNQTNEIKNMMASLFQINTTSTSGSGSLPSNNVANPKGELKAITTRSGLVLDGPSVPTPPSFINPEVDERVEETLTDRDLFEYTIKVPPPPVSKYKPSSKRDFVMHQMDPLHSNILYPLRILKQKQQEKDKKKLGLPELIFTRMTLELANRAICTPAGIAKDVFVSVKFTFPADFVIVDYESDPRVPLILGRSFLRTARALIDVHGEEMILCDGDERLILNMRHDTSSYSNQSQKESINLINVFNDSKGGNVLSEKLLDFDSTKDLHPTLHVNQLSGNTTYSSSPNQLLEEFTDELALITFPLEYDDDLQFDIEFDLKEIEYLLHQYPIKDIDSSLKDSIDQSNLVDLDNNLVDSMPEMFTDKHALDYSSPSLFDEYDDNLF